MLIILNTRPVVFPVLLLQRMKGGKKNTKLIQQGEREILACKVKCVANPMTLLLTVFDT